jgi:hypothetical protein
MLTRGLVSQPHFAPHWWSEKPLTAIPRQAEDKAGFRPDGIQAKTSVQMEPAVALLTQ